MAFMVRDQLNSQKCEPIQTKMIAMLEARTIHGPFGHLWSSHSQFSKSLDVCRYTGFKSWQQTVFVVPAPAGTGRRPIGSRCDLCLLECLAWPGNLYRKFPVRAIGRRSRGVTWIIDLNIDDSQNTNE